MIENLKISIITPVLNGERYLEFCIKNVISQNCKGIEHIIIDGMSQDRTVDMIRYYSNQYEHIRWVSEKDSGQSEAMNKGIYAAKNNIIGILNVDDFYEPNVLNRIISIFSTLQKSSLVVGNCNIWNNDGSLKKVNRPKNMALQELLKGPHINIFPANPSAYFYHKSLHDMIGYYDVNDHYAMDLDFILRAVQRADVYYYDEIWGNFRLFKNTKTYNSKKKGLLNSRIKNKLKKYKKYNSFFDKLIYRIVYEYQNIIFPWWKYNLSQFIYLCFHPKKFLIYVSKHFKK